MKKILVVDDDIGILEALSLALDMEGYAVETTTKEEGIYKKIASFKPDVIILDILLSGYDGRHICQKVKNQKKTKNIPVIMISAHPSAAKTVKNFGADDFLAKPFSFDSLLKLVKKSV